MTRYWLLLLFVVALMPTARAQGSSADAELSAFNQKFTAAVLHMDNAAVMALWAKDGVTLLPGLAPIQGKDNIARWLDGLSAKFPGYRVVKQEDDFHPVQAGGDWASEWANTVQVVQPPEGKPPIETHGKMLLVLHREADGWRIEAEMWTPSPAQKP